jgi:hypothetical protein
MNKIYNLLAVFSLVNLHAQGLRGEHAFNDNFSHSIQGLVCSGDETFVFHNSWIFNNLTAGEVKLSKMGSNGNEIWDVPATPPIGEVPQFIAAVEDENAVAYICGSPQACDYSTGFRYCFRKVNAYGDVLWEHLWIDVGQSSLITFMSNIHGLTKDNSGKYLFNYSLNQNAHDTSSVSIFNSDGSLFQTLEIDQYELSEIRLGTNFYLLGTSGNKLFGFDNDGSTLDSIVLNENIINFSLVNNTIYLLTASGVYTFNEDFSPLNSTSLTSFGTSKKMKIIDGEVQVVVFQAGQYLVLVLNEDLTVANTKSIMAELPENAHIDFNNNHFAVGNSHALYYSASSRFRDFSLTNPFNIQTNWTDIGISDVEVTDVVIQPQPNIPAVNNVKVFVNVELANYGNQVLNSCRINYHQGMHFICGQVGYSQEFFDLNLAPGTSTWITIGVVHDETNHFTSNTGVISRNICLYTSFPNQQTDLIVGNDHFCKSVVLGHVGLDENEMHAPEKTLHKIVDLLGREIPFQTNQVMIFMYTDGSSEKVFVVE